MRPNCPWIPSHRSCDNPRQIQLDVETAGLNVLFMTQLDAGPSTGRAADTTGGGGGKGLGGNSVGLLGSAVIGVSTVAPVYCLTSTLGSTAGEVGLQMPAVFLAGFLPMLLVAFAYRELNK